MISYKFNECKLFNTVRYSVPLTNNATYLFRKFSPNYLNINSYLTNHWPLNNNLNDIISNANLIESYNASFTTDRLNQKLSAIYLNNGYLRLPTGVFFYGDFSFSTWIKIYSYTSCTKLVFYCCYKNIYIYIYYTFILI
jgi:hypothetical protein